MSKVPPRARARKVSSNRAEIEEMFAELAGRDDYESRLETRLMGDRERRREADRDREKLRQRSRMRGVVRGYRGFLVEKRDRSAPGDDDQPVELTANDLRALEALKGLIDELEGRGVEPYPRYLYVRRLRAAYRAAFNSWERELLACVRTSVGWPASKRRRAPTGRQILAWLRARFDDVPEGLTAALISEAIHKSTLNPRGGGRSKRRNVEVVVGELVERLGGKLTP